MTTAECEAANKAVKATIMVCDPNNPDDLPTAVPASDNWQGHGPMYLITDGRETVLDSLYDPEQPDWWSPDDYVITGKFACPYCGEYALHIDAFDPNSPDATHAECNECQCAIKADKPYSQWQQGDAVFIWW